VGDQDRTGAAHDDAADEGEQLPGGMRVERGGRLVEDDEVERLQGDGEGARDSTIWRLPRGRSRMISPVRCRGREDLVELAANELAGATPPSDAGQRRVEDAGILRHGQVRAEGKLLEDAADAELLGEADGIVALLLPGDGDAAAVGAERAGEHMHQASTCRPIMADEADALARVDGEIDAVKRADGAEVLFDAVQPHDVRL